MASGLNNLLMRNIPLFQLGWTWLLSLGLLTTTQAQTINLTDCLEAAQSTHPLTQKTSLLSEQLGQELEILRRNWFPRIVLNGQATLQSEVTELPIELPGVEIASLSRDQYKVYAEINQTLYDGGAIKLQQNLRQLNQQVANQQIEVSLYQLNEQVLQAYFGILLLDAQTEQLALLRKDLEVAQRKVKAAIDNGLAFPSQEKILLAERLKLRQRETELKHARQSFLALLNRMTGLELDYNSQFAEPATISGLSLNLQARPELLLLDHQRTFVRAQTEMLQVKRRPKAGLFLQGGFGRPALNFLSNEFRPYAIGGLRVSWDLTPTYTRKNEEQLIFLQGKQLDIQEEAFRYQTDLQLRRQSEEVAKLLELLQTDQELIVLRAEIRETAQAQLENGVMTATDYLQELNAEDHARQNLLLHQLQLRLAQYQQQNTLGN